MRHLRSGHSHEDVDQLFGSLSLHIIKHGKQIETPSAFCHIIKQFVDSARRPFEPERVVVKFDQHRPWTLGQQVSMFLEGVPIFPPISLKQNSFNFTLTKEGLFGWSGSYYASRYRRTGSTASLRGEQKGRSWWLDFQNFKSVVVSD